MDHGDPGTMRCCIRSFGTDGGSCCCRFSLMLAVDWSSIDKNQSFGFVGVVA